MKDRSYAVDRDLNGRAVVSGAIVLRRVDREHEVRAFGAALAMAALLHLGLVFYLTRPASVSRPVPASPDTTHMTFTDTHLAAPPIEDPTYPPVVKPLLPDVTPAIDTGSGVADPSQAKMSASVVVDPRDLVGKVFYLSDRQKSLDSLLVLPAVGPGVRTVLGARSRDTLGTVPFVSLQVKPRLVSVPQPTYPEVVRVAGIQGKTVVKALVDTDGAVAAVEVFASSGNAMLDAAACEAARGAKFTPGMQRDRPVKVWVAMPFDFRLQ